MLMTTTTYLVTVNMVIERLARGQYKQGQCFLTQLCSSFKDFMSSYRAKRLEKTQDQFI